MYENPGPAPSCQRPCLSSQILVWLQDFSIFRETMRRSRLSVRLVRMGVAILEYGPKLLNLNYGN